MHNTLIMDYTLVLSEPNIEATTTWLGDDTLHRLSLWQIILRRLFDLVPKKSIESIERWCQHHSQCSWHFKMKENRNTNNTIKEVCL